MSLSRRKLLKATASGIAMGSMGVPLLSSAQSKTVKIGMNIPMTGDYAPWGSSRTVWLRNHCQQYKY